MRGIRQMASANTRTSLTVDSFRWSKWNSQNGKYFKFSHKYLFHGIFNKPTESNNNNKVKEKKRMNICLNLTISIPIIFHFTLRNLHHFIQSHQIYYDSFQFSAVCLWMCVWKGSIEYKSRILNKSFVLGIRFTEYANRFV